MEGSVDAKTRAEKAERAERLDVDQWRKNTWHSTVLSRYTRHVPTTKVPRFLTVIAPDSHERVKQALVFSQDHLSGFLRRSGESYAQNCFEVAETLSEVTHDPSLIAVALLHDLPTHPDADRLIQEAPLTDDERALIVRMSSLRRLHIDLQTQDLNRVIDAFLAEPRLLPLRMAHRLTDIRHLHRFTKKDQRDIARETLHMYAAIAGRLGMHAWRHEMEDVCFRFLKPDAVKTLEKKFALHAKNDRACLRHVQEYLRSTFSVAKIPADMSYRTKALYSTYCKMVVKRRKFEDLTDRLALRIIVPTIPDCYRALGLVHTHLRPIPGKLKDYIGAPKENGYRSIHTVIYPLPGVTEYPIEIQMRTPEIHEECEYGFARHSDYKSLTSALDTVLSRVDLFRNLQSLKDHAHSPEQFERSLRTYFQDSTMTIFDDQNNLYHLSSPLVALDFVCQVFPKRFAFLKSLRINGQIKAIDVLLKNGDTVEAVFGRKRMITADWVGICKHASSKKACRDALASI